MKLLSACVVSLAALTAAPPAAAAEPAYPDMIGAWTGTIRQVASGTNLAGTVARGGAVIQDVDLVLTVFHQDGEVFIGESRSNAQTTNPAAPVWGAIRSNGKEGVFVTGTGGRGNVWFLKPTELEFCFANLNEAVMSAYCGVLKKNAGGP